MLVEYVPDCVPYEKMYPAIFDAVLLFHVPVTVAAVTGGALEIRNAIDATARSAHTICVLTVERQRDEFIS
jgi:hypothetical protein